MRPGPAVAASAAVLGVLATPRAAFAEPNLTVGVTVGGGAGSAPAGGVRGVFALGGRFGALFLRSRDADMGVGPYVDVGTVGFDSIDVGAGAEWLLPVFEQVPFVVSAGPFARRDAVGWHPGASATWFAGTRSHNFHAPYGLTAGFFAQTRVLADAGARVEVLLGAQIDTALLALPFLLALNAAR